MKNPIVIGLLGAGGVGRSFLARMPVLLSHLGPVKAASFGVARRISNTLRAGRPSLDYVPFAECDLICVAVPESSIDRVGREISSEISLERKIVVLCNSTRDSFWPSPLLAGGALVATLNAVDESRERLFVAEGDPVAMRALRKVIAAERRKLIELRAASKALYVSGVNLSTHLLLPWIAASVESLRDAGLSRVEATQIANALGSRALRAYSKAGPKAWSASAAERLRLSIARDLDTIRAADPKLAALYADGVTQALRYFEPDK